jgi:cytochrome c oxidase subunit II
VPPVPRGRRIRLAATTAVLLLASACAKDAPQDVLKPEGPYGRKIDSLWNAVIIPAAVVFVLVLGLVVVTVVRHRHRPGRPEPVQVHGNTRLEITWTVIPALLLLGVAVPTISTIFDLSRDPKGEPLRVEVGGHVWWWEYRYEGLGIVTANELHIPTGRPVRLSLHSKETGFGPDVSGVIHSYWVPKLAGKQDVVPGRTNHITLQADRPGFYPGQCAEFCGLSHANMRLAVIAHTPEGFEAWVANQQSPAPQPAPGSAAARGFGVFTSKGCNGCHTIGGVAQAAGIQGPNLTHVMSRQKFAGYIFETNVENLKKWVHDPPGMKPMAPDRGLGMPNLGLSRQEVDDVVAYLETLK